jgi:hypothetical protein
MPRSTLQRLSRTAVLAVLCLALAACANQKINQENYSKLQKGMTLKEVEDLFGATGTKEEGGDGSAVANQFGMDIPGTEAATRRPPGDTYVWERGNITITVFFDRDGRVVTWTQKGL